MRTQFIPLARVYSKDKASQTINGYVVSLWKDWENFLPKAPQQMYLNVCFPHSIKGPHLHMQRWGQFATISGKGRFIVKYGENDYEKIDVDASQNPGFIIIPAGTPCAIQNPYDEMFVLANLPSPAWHPDNQDENSVIFDAEVLK